MSDPFDVLRDQLAAAERRAAGRPRGAPRVLWIAAAVLLFATATAAAVVAVTRSEHSQPLTGRGTGLVHAGSEARYRIEFYPRLAAGHADWCSDAIVRSGQEGSGGGGCGPAAPAGAALIAGGGMGSPQPGQRSLNWLVVDQQVAAVRLPGGRTIRPRAAPSIPYGWRSVVWFGHGLDEQVRLLDDHGRELPMSNDMAGTRAAGTGTLATRSVNPYAPGGGCAIRVRRAPGVRALQEQVVNAPAPAHASINTRAFRACAAVSFQAQGGRYRAAVLLDAADPTRVAARLPGMPPRTPGREATTANGDITARRAGKGWLAVQGPNPHQRLILLRALRATT